MNSHTTSQIHMHKHLCWIGRGTHIRGTQHDNKLQHGHTQQDINGTVITCVHTWDSHVFTLFVCGMQRIHKHKKVGCTLTESLPKNNDGRQPPNSLLQPVPLQPPACANNGTVPKFDGNDTSRCLDKGVVCGRGGGRGTGPGERKSMDSG